MSSRPTKTIDWASDAGALVIEPSSGYKTAGFAGGDPLIADYENWLRKQIDAWLNYVNETAWSASISASSAVVVEDTGKTFTRPSGSFLDEGFAVGQTVSWFGFANPENNVTGIITVLTATVMTIGGASGLVDETGSGDEHCNAHFGLTGQVTIAPSLGAADNALIVRGGDVLLDVGANLVVTGESSFQDLVTLQGDASVPSGHKITLVGSADIKHGGKVLTLNAYAGMMSDVAAAQWTTGGGPGFITSSGAAILYVPIPLREGDRITSVEVQRYGDGAVDGTFILQRFINGTLTSDPTVSVTNAAASWNTTTLTPSSPAVLAAGEVHFLELVASAANLKIGNILVHYDRP